MAGPGLGRGAGRGRLPRAYTQNERLPTYAAALSSLESSGQVYPCFCARRAALLASAPHGTAGDGSPIYPAPAGRSPLSARETLPGPRALPGWLPGRSCPSPTSSPVPSASPTACGGDFALRRSGQGLRLPAGRGARRHRHEHHPGGARRRHPHQHAARQLLLTASSTRLHPPTHLPLLPGPPGGERLAKRHEIRSPLAALTRPKRLPLAITGSGPPGAPAAQPATHPPRGLLPALPTSRSSHARPCGC